MAPDTLAPVPPRGAGELVGLRPCPQCGAWQWPQGLTYYQCAACGYRHRPTPAEIVSQPPQKP
jgi:hypothetical protein